METKVNLMESVAEAAVLDYENACANLAKVFAKHYYDINIPSIDFYWVAGRIGGVAVVCDEFYDVRRMYEALAFEATCAQLNEYCNAEVDAAMEDKKLDVSFENFVKYGWGLEAV